MQLLQQIVVATFITATGSSVQTLISDEKAASTPTFCCMATATFNAKSTFDSFFEIKSYLLLVTNEISAFRAIHTRKTA